MVSFKNFHSGERFQKAAFSSDTCGWKAKTKKKKPLVVFSNEMPGDFCCDLTAIDFTAIQRLRITATLALSTRKRNFNDDREFFPLKKKKIKREWSTYPLSSFVSFLCSFKGTESASHLELFNKLLSLRENTCAASEFCFATENFPL